MPPGREVTVYPVISAPFADGAVKLTFKLWLPFLAAVTAAGAPGTAAVGVTGADGSDGAPEPFAFAAVTVNVYEILYDRPVTVIGLEPLPARLTVMPSGSEVTVYDVI